MAAEMLEIEVWVKVNESGEYEVGCNEDEAKERFEENVSGDELTRLVRMVVKVPAPRPLTVNVTLPEDEADAERTATVTAS